MSNPNSPSGGPPLRALAMVLIALAIVFAGLGAMSLSSSDSSSASGSTTSSPAAPTTTAAQPVSPAPATAPATTAPSSSAAPTTTAAPSTTTAAPTTTAAALDKSVPVQVLNNSTVSGLAAKTGSQLTADGFNVTGTGNYPNGVIPKTTVYYGNSPQEQAVAQAIAAELGCAAEPKFSGLGDSSPGVVVIVTGN
ncbi:LytR C-terminal domain-containing protein [Nocardia sp. NPDC020380]|uniref:LytR C-terminal domain-containing protein n=1 Tax=Nocardia sp. NPDC020380 TaxID=3364309 RepID=UPI0037B0DCEF